MQTPRLPLATYLLTHLRGRKRGAWALPTLTKDACRAKPQPSAHHLRSLKALLSLRPLRQRRVSRYQQGLRMPPAIQMTAIALGLVTLSASPSTEMIARSASLAEQGLGAVHRPIVRDGIVLATTNAVTKRADAAAITVNATRGPTKMCPAPALVGPAKTEDQDHEVLGTVTDATIAVSALPVASATPAAKTATDAAAPRPPPKPMVP